MNADFVCFGSRDQLFKNLLKPDPASWRILSDRTSLAY